MSLTEQYRKDFQKTFASFGASGHSLWQVWEDFLTAASGILMGTLDQFGQIDPGKMDDFDRALSKYTDDELDKFGKMFDDLKNAYQVHPEQDFLGEIFMQLGISDKWKGQFFTPYCLAKVMAMSTVKAAKESVDAQGWCAVTDPACGAGVTLLAVRNELQQLHIGTDRALFVGQDISSTACKMCHIQLSLMGCAGYVVCADTLMNPLVKSPDGISPALKEGQTARFTPLWYGDAWQGRMAARYMDACVRAGRHG